METAKPSQRRRNGVFLPGLRKARARSGLTQDQLAGKAEVERATISNLETGNRAAQPLTLRKLADALGIAPEELTALPLGQPTLFPTEPGDRSVAYLTAMRRMLNRLENRLEEAVYGGVADMGLAEFAATFEADIWERVVPEIRLMHGIGGLPKAERDAHELVYVALLDLGGTVQEAYNAAVRSLTDRKAKVVGFDRLQAAMEERERAQQEGRRRVEESRTA